MRFSSSLYRQHISRMFDKHWRLQGKRTPIETGAEAELRQRGIELTDPNEFIKEKRENFQKIEVNLPFPKTTPMDENHPLYNLRPSYKYGEQSILVEGLKQAQVLTNTVQLNEGLPQVIQDLAKSKAAPQQDILVQRSILASQVFDAVQEKLPKYIDPARPAYTFRRIYGIPDYRVNRLLTSKLVYLCAVLSGHAGLTVYEAPTRSSLEHEGQLVSLSTIPGVLLSSSTPLPPAADPLALQEVLQQPLPDISPLKPVVSLPTTHFYESSPLFPFPRDCSHPHVHTAVFHFNKTQARNLHETPVTEDQFLGRTLMHTYAVAVAQARQRFGRLAEEKLPKPVTLQGIHTDGKIFHFVVLQLNSLSTEGVKNVMWSSPQISLYNYCGYFQGSPSLEDYNPEVFSHFLAFYRHGIGALTS